MRSKQQPRPSYRWLDKGEQDCDETPDQQQHDEIDKSTKIDQTNTNRISSSTNDNTANINKSPTSSSSSSSSSPSPSFHGQHNNLEIIETTKDLLLQQEQQQSKVKILQKFPISKLKTNSSSIDDDDNNINHDNDASILSLIKNDDNDDDSKSLHQLNSSLEKSNHPSIANIKIDLTSDATTSISIVKTDSCQQNKSPKQTTFFHSNKHEQKLPTKATTASEVQQICDNLLQSESNEKNVKTTVKKQQESMILPLLSKESSASPPLPPRSIITLSNNHSITGMSECIKNIENCGGTSGGGGGNSKNSSNRNQKTAIGDTGTPKSTEDLILTYDDEKYDDIKPQKSFISGLEACVQQLKNESRSKHTFEPYRNKNDMSLPSTTSFFQPTITTAISSSTSTTMPTRTTRCSSRLAAAVATEKIKISSESSSSSRGGGVVGSRPKDFMMLSDTKSSSSSSVNSSYNMMTNNSTKMMQFIGNSFEDNLKQLHSLQQLDNLISRRNEQRFQKMMNESELASPRCQSRESSGSGGRLSDDSNCSGNGSTSAGQTPTSPVGITLPATLPPGAAAALLPPQSAAMAAYLNVAAAAAQQNRLLLGNPLAAAAAGLVQAAQSPTNLPLSSPMHPDDASILDFSTKRMRKDSDTDSKSDSDAVNLSKSSDNGESAGQDYAPLDLSTGTKKRVSEPLESPTLHRKIPRHNQTTPTPGQVPTPWVTPINPYLAAVAAASLSPKNHLDWNGKSKIPSVAPNDAAKALEKMSEMTRLGGPPDNDIPMRLANNQVNNNHTNNSNSGSTGRHSAWQSHWLNKGADAAKDVFKCVWCKQSFPTLATLTTHMKETQHCGVNVPPSGNLPSQQGNNGGQNQQQQQQHHHQQSQNSSSNSSNNNKSDLNLLIKETMPLPRKLVRGQDVWLGKGAEQTRQILKCMWCGQSFRSLAEMTSHMQQTQHYTNIISQEQIISWKSAEEGKGGGGGGGGSNGGQTANANSSTNSTVSAVLTCKVCDQAFSSLKDLSNHMVKNAHYKEHIMRSITESGGRRRQTREKRKKSLPVRKLLELERAQHDFKNGDIKNMRPTSADLNISTRIKCEKCGEKIETALFVEHIRLCVGGDLANNIPRNSNNMMNKSMNANSIIPPDSMSPLTPTSSRDGRKSIGGCDDSATSPASSNRHISPHAPDLSSPISSKDGIIGSGGGGGGGSIGGSNSSGGEKSSPSVLNAIEQLIEKSFDTRSRHNTPGFSQNNHASAPLGSSILKRLGIDESVDYTKPLIDPQTMSLLRSYQNSQYPRRERSGSESSSVSDRGSSRLESLTPERKPDMMFSNHISPRESPDKATNYSNSEHEDEHNNNNNINNNNNNNNNKDSSSIKVKSEPLDGENDDDAPTNNNNNNNNNKNSNNNNNTNNNENKNENDENHELQHKEIKKELTNLDENDRDNHSEIDENNELDLSSPTKQHHRKSNTPSRSAAPSPHQPISHSFQSHSTGTGTITPAASPCSDRSTPRSTTNSINNDNNKKLSSGSGSLNALSSMFDNLTGTGSMGGANDPNNSNGGVNGNKKTTSHPLAALQKLCDKTETTSNNRAGSSSGALSSSMPTMGGSSPGNILAFSWACNDAVITQDSIIKCTLCDTPFCSKGAYRHHLSKVHFVKDDIAEPMTMKSCGSSAGSAGSSENNRSASVSSNKSLPHSRSQSPKMSVGLNMTTNSLSASSAKSPSPSTSSSAMGAPNSNQHQQHQQHQQQQQQQQQQPAAAQSPFDESPHSKFLKYTELAKQLSSKYV